MVKKSIVIVLFLFIAGYSAAAQKKCEKFTDESLKVSFCIPAGWKVMDNPQTGNKVIVGNRVGNVLANINLRGNDRPGTLEETVDSSTENIVNSQSIGGFKFGFVSKQPFTAGKSSGIKVVFKLQRGKDTAKTIQYFFSANGDVKVFFTATIPWLNSQAMEKAVDEAIETFEVTNLTSEGI